jgi:hypothetical protein
MILMSAPARVASIDPDPDKPRGEGGAEAAAEARPRGRGLLVLLARGLYFHSWIGGRELFVAGPAITYLGLADRGPRGRRARGPITLRFLNAAAKEDGITIRVPWAGQWTDAIRARLIGRKA